MNKQDIKIVIAITLLIWCGNVIGYLYAKTNIKPELNTVYVDKIIHKEQPKDTVAVRITGYHANFAECGNDLGYCFDGSKIPDGYDTIKVKWCAVSQDKTSNRLKNTVDILLPDSMKAFLLKGIAF